MNPSNMIGTVAGKSKAVSATGSSVGTTIDMDRASGLHIVNTSTTLYVCVRFGTSSQTAVLDQDLAIPPQGQVVVGANEGITHVAAIGSGAGPTKVVFTPIYGA